jgi:hypothetical protein
MRAALLLLACAAGFLQDPPRAGAAPASPQPRLDVRWEALTNPWPAVVWVYRVLPNVFPTAVISNVVAITGYSMNDETLYGTNGMVFIKKGRAGNLWISFAEGGIHYDNETAVPFGITNLATAVPEENQLYQLTSNFIAQLGIGFDELVKKTNSTEPYIHYLQDQVIFFSTNSTITNIWSREAHFHRVLDGMEFIGFDRGGDGAIEFGDHATILRFNLSWWNAMRDKAYPSVSPATIMQWIRQGKVRPENIPGLDTPRIRDWSGVKSVTVTRAKLVCVGEPGVPTLRPFAWLQATVDTGTTNFLVGINCPAFEEQAHPEGMK